MTSAPPPSPGSSPAGSSPAGSTPPGATSVGAPERSRKRPLALIGVGVAVLAVLLLVLLLSRCGSDDDGSSGTAAATSAAGGSTSPSTTSSAPSSATSSSAGSPVAATGRPSSIVAADGTAVLDPAAPADPTAVLGQVSGQTVTGTAVQVLSVPADEGFWIGSTNAQRIWVQLTGAAGESPYQVRQGDRVDFTGTVVAHDAGFPATVGVDDAEGAAQLSAQGQHIEVDRAALALSS